jgi:hypothetical protein
MGSNRLRELAIFRPVYGYQINQACLDLQTAVEGIDGAIVYKPYGTNRDHLRLYLLGRSELVSSLGGFASLNFLSSKYVRDCVGTHHRRVDDKEKAIVEDVIVDGFQESINLRLLLKEDDGLRFRGESRKIRGGLLAATGLTAGQSELAAWRTHKPLIRIAHFPPDSAEIYKIEELACVVREHLPLQINLGRVVLPGSVFY